MKTLGLLGGMSWESTVTYYKLINEKVKENLGGFHSARILLNSVDFAELEKYMTGDQWEDIKTVLSKAAKTLENAGADCIVICTNTMHKVAPEIAASINIPLLHIAEATADVLIVNQIDKVALLGTKYTMTQDFYKDKLTEKNLEVVVPDSREIELINKIIFDELCLGIISEKSKQAFLDIIESLKKQGVQGAILGCTEIGLLIDQNDTDLKLFDTTEIHASKAAEFALEDE